MKQATYKLLTNAGNRTFFAKVAVEVVDGQEGPRVRLGADAFGWLKPPYAPAEHGDAGPLELQQAAVTGVEYALARAGRRGDGITVVVQEIVDSAADSTPACVAYAACQATWNALGVNEELELRIVGGSLVFPGV